LHIGHNLTQTGGGGGGDRMNARKGAVDDAALNPNLFQFLTIWHLIYYFGL
jgi:hypothetical protein